VYTILPSSAPDTQPLDTASEQLGSAVGWVAAAATLIAEDVRSSEWDVWRQTGPAREDWDAQPDSELAKFLQRPNPKQTLAEVLELTDLHFSLTGMAFWHIIRPTTRSTAQGFEVLYPHWVTEPVFTNGQHSGWRVLIPGHAPRIIPAEDVIWIKRPHPLDPWSALSQLAAAAASQHLDLYTRAYAYGVMRNDGGIPAGLISSDQELTKDQAEAIQESWRQKYSQRHGELAVLGTGAKYQPIGIPMQDLKFLELGDFTREQILAMFRVPPAVLGQSKDFNRANSEAAMVAYQRQALKPRLARYQDAINTLLLPTIRGADGLWFEFQDPVDVDKTVEQQLALNDLKAGVITVNQYLESIDRDPQPDGEVYLVPSNVTIKDTLEPAPPPGMTPTAPQAEGEEDEEGLPAPPPPEAEPERAYARLEAAVLRAEVKRLRRDALADRWYRAWRGTVAGWMEHAKREGYPDGWAPPRDELEATRAPALPERHDDETTLEYLERLKGPAGKELAREVATCALP